MKQTMKAVALNAKGKVIGVGSNSYDKSHPLQKHFAMLAGESEKKIYQHAELAAVLSSGKKHVHTIYIQRFGKEKNMLNARACASCLLMLKAFGVKYMRYTHPDGIKMEAL